MCRRTILQDRTAVHIECHPVFHLCYRTISTSSYVIVWVVRINLLVHPVSRHHLLPSFRHSLGSTVPSAARTTAASAAPSTSGCAREETNDVPGQRSTTSSWLTGRRLQIRRIPRLASRCHLLLFRVQEAVPPLRVTTVQAIVAVTKLAFDGRKQKT
jgi:hypothetical protein